jgi:exodeoxyribonuclease VII large subunit
MKVIARGRIGIYPPRGEYQIILDYLEPMGVGALALAFEQLKEKLAAKGVFDKDIKKPLPFLPQRVALITSPTGAAIRDFLKIIHRRFANIEIIVIPVRVQGEGASGDMVKALDTANRQLKVDVIVLTRGGGSIEDLWAFNEEELALAIRRSNIPVVSAVGHEIDITISDLAADLRAPTPSAAAELLVAEKEALVGHVMDMQNRMESAVKARMREMANELNRLSRGLRDPRKRLGDIWMRLDDIQSRLVRAADLIVRERRSRLHSGRQTLLLHSPMNIMSSMMQQLDFLKISLGRSVNKRVSDIKTTLGQLEKQMKDLSPQSVLNRGYSITRKLPEKRILRDASGVQKEDRVQVLLAKGELGCRVERVEAEG